MLPRKRAVGPLAAAEAPATAGAASSLGVGRPSPPLSPSPGLHAGHNASVKKPGQWVVAHVLDAEVATVVDEQVVNGSNEPHLHDKSILRKVGEVALQGFVQ